MATRSRIGIRESNGTVTSVYCHWDGYPEHNGDILVKYYTNEAKIRKLLDLGDMSVLGRDLGKKHRFEDRVPNTCTFYGRDRDDIWCSAINMDMAEFLAGHAGEDYFYLFDPAQKRWLCYKGTEPHSADGMFSVEVSQTDVQRLTEYANGLRGYGFYELFFRTSAQTFAFKSKKDLIVALSKIDDLADATIRGRMFYTQEDF